VVEPAQRTVSHRHDRGRPYDAWRMRTRLWLATALAGLSAALCACGSTADPPPRRAAECVRDGADAVEVAAMWRDVLHACASQDGTVWVVNDSAAVLVVDASGSEEDVTLGTHPGTALANSVYAALDAEAVVMPAGVRVPPRATVVAPRAGVGNVYVEVDPAASAERYFTSVVTRWVESRLTTPQLAMAGSVRSCASALTTEWIDGNQGRPIEVVFLDAAMVMRACPSLFDEVSAAVPPPATGWAAELTGFAKNAKSSAVDDLVSLVRRALS
jgi:hypothetical protein